MMNQEYAKDDTGASDGDHRKLVPECQSKASTPKEEHETHNRTQRARYYSIKYGARPLRNIVRWIDKHDGFVTALATVFIALLTYSLAEDSKRQADSTAGQLRAMQQQLDEMKSSGKQTDALIEATKESAKAAKDAVDLARENAERQLRAYVVVDNLTIQPDGSSVLIQVRFKNTGQTPAYNVSSEALFFFGNPLGAVIRLKHPELASGTTTLGSGITGFHTGEIDFSGYEAVENDPKAILFIYGEVTYLDAFGRPHYTRFRFQRGGIVGNKWIFVNTPEGNEAD